MKMDLRRIMEGLAQLKTGPGVERAITDAEIEKTADIDSMFPLTTHDQLCELEENIRKDPKISSRLVSMLCDSHKLIL